MQFQFCSSFPFWLRAAIPCFTSRDGFGYSKGNVCCELDSMVVVMLFDPGGFLCEPWAAVVSILFYQNFGVS